MHQLQTVLQQQHSHSYEHSNECGDVEGRLPSELDSNIDALSVASDSTVANDDKQRRTFSLLEMKQRSMRAKPEAHGRYHMTNDDYGLSKEEEEWLEGLYTAYRLNPMDRDALQKMIWSIDRESLDKEQFDDKMRHYFLNPEQRRKQREMLSVPSMDQVPAGHSTGNLLGESLLSSEFSLHDAKTIEEIMNQKDDDRDDPLDVISFESLLRYAVLVKERCVTTLTERDMMTIDAFVLLGGSEDGSGEVQVDTLKQTVETFQLNIDVDAFVAAIDQNGDGTISFEEFAWLYNVGLSGGTTTENHANTPPLVALGGGMSPGPSNMNLPSPLSSEPVNSRRPSAQDALLALKRGAQQSNTFRHSMTMNNLEASVSAGFRKKRVHTRPPPVDCTKLASPFDVLGKLSDVMSAHDARLQYVETVHTSKKPSDTTSITCIINELNDTRAPSLSGEMKFKTASRDLSNSRGSGNWAWMKAPYGDSHDTPSGRVPIPPRPPVQRREEILAELIRKRAGLNEKARSHSASPSRSSSQCSESPRGRPSEDTPHRSGDVTQLHALKTQQADYDVQVKQREEAVKRRVQELQREMRALEAARQQQRDALLQIRLAARKSRMTMLQPTKSTQRSGHDKESAVDNPDGSRSASVDVDNEKPKRECINENSLAPQSIKALSNVKGEPTVAISPRKPGAVRWTESTNTCIDNHPQASAADHSTEPERTEAVGPAQTSVVYGEDFEVEGDATNDLSCEVSAAKPLGEPKPADETEGRELVPSSSSSRSNSVSSRSATVDSRVSHDPASGQARCSSSSSSSDDLEQKATRTTARCPEMAADHPRPSAPVSKPQGPGHHRPASAKLQTTKRTGAQVPRFLRDFEYLYSSGAVSKGGRPVSAASSQRTPPIIANAMTKKSQQPLTNNNIKQNNTKLAERMTMILEEPKVDAAMMRKWTQ